MTTYLRHQTITQPILVVGIVSPNSSAAVAEMSHNFDILLKDKGPMPVEGVNPSTAYKATNSIANAKASAYHVFPNGDNISDEAITDDCVVHDVRRGDALPIGSGQ
ncbi:hypothetical protein FRB94_010027 [Tulasnella sp. JGI-2019a]|nr:hypothetical protein FRB93_011115 [Tulasnella sp. JGI-2019a]KAG9010749.1 hypothetical protein FRB94_010027 [Tulasnella sp. JGI-2019a]